MSDAEQRRPVEHYYYEGNGINLKILYVRKCFLSADFFFVCVCVCVYV